MSSTPRIVRGIVRAKRPIAGVAVSNGETIVQTDAAGCFELPVVPDKHSTIFICVLDGYEAEDAFFRRITDISEGGSTIFHLRKTRKRIRGVFLHLTDLHLTHAPARASSARGAETIRARLRTLSDAERDAGLVIATGDLTNAGDEPSLRAWRRLADSTRFRLVSMFGGHDGNWECRHGGPDVRPPWTRNFEGLVAPLYYSFEWRGCHFTQYPSEDFHLGPARCALRDRWFERDLALARKRRLPLILLMHAPPKAAFVRRMKAKGVIAVFCGHWHSAKAYFVGGVPVYATPPPFFGGIDSRAAGYRRVTVTPGRITVRLKTLQCPPLLASPPKGASVLWTRRIPGGLHRAGLVLADGRLLVSLSDEDLSRAAGVLALDPVTGRTLWRVRTDSSV
ncbi:MAG: metallophosphoesterase, partial [Planctomycetota bacterium]